MYSHIPFRKSSEVGAANWNDSAKKPNREYITFRTLNHYLLIELQTSWSK